MGITRPRNYELGNSGVMRFSATRMYRKRAVYRLKKKGGDKKQPEKKSAEVKKKQIGGDKNGGTRLVRVNRPPKSYQTAEVSRKLKNKKGCFSKHKRNLRTTITPGTVLILLAGRHKGKRVVFLKQLNSGLLLVTGPFRLNGCPLRRVNQIYVIATKTKVDISKISIPDRVNDAYFRRKVLKKPKHAEGEIFEQKKEVYSVSDERKEDQLTVDKSVLEAIRAHPEKKLLFGYLGAMFSLNNRQYPHKMIF
ncbi:DgyrCDS7432 [Dimorphilus gyrociliatus]|uniref:Large ribosomal subunit protein eL6 n=1 Tax=Dimorphilus gyrociliatus TaxID=2664684 RepID=A0A7I8VRZ5_9ANNE|nr:DgyrCDS7432 [Dimorphilus gyrociliatus]